MLFSHFCYITHITFSLFFPHSFMKKHILTPLFALMLCVPFASAQFSDVRSSDLYSEAITYVKDQGIVNGYTDGTFRPQNKISRIEFLKILIEAKFKREDIDACTTRNPYGDAKFAYFVDTPANQWYTPYLCIGKEKGIIKGDQDKGTFRPSDNITIAEGSKVVAEAFRFELDNLGQGQWYRRYVDALSQRNAIPLSILSVKDEITRAEMAEIIYRLSEKIEDRPSQTTRNLEE